MSASTHPIHRRPSTRSAPNPRRTPSPGSSRALAPLFCTLLHKSETHPVPFQSVAHSLQKHPGCHPERHFNSSILNCSAFSPASPAESTLVDVLRVLPCFSRSCPPASPLDATLTDFASVTPLSATLTKAGGRGGRSQPTPGGTTISGCAGHPVAPVARRSPQCYAARPAGPHSANSPERCLP
jgi:hypothetical protein